MTPVTRRPHLPLEPDQILEIVSRSTFFAEWADHLEACSDCEQRLRVALEENASTPCPPMLLDKLDRLEQQAPSKGLLLRLGLLGVASIVLVWGLSMAIRGPATHLLVVSRTPDRIEMGAAIDSLEVRVLGDSPRSTLTRTLAMDPATGACRVELGRRRSGTVLVRSLSGAPNVAGTTRFGPGANLVVVGPTGSPPHSAYSVVRLLADDSPMSRRVISRLPFTPAEAHAETGLRFTQLDPTVSVVLIDDLELFDGDSLLWSESFETTPPGELPGEGWSVVYPHEGNPRGSGLPQGYVIDSRNYGASRSFVSISVPEHARVDGHRVTPEMVHSGVLRYRARVLLPTEDDRGSMIGLKKATGDPAKWYDPACVVFARGEVRANRYFVGRYRPGRWTSLEVSVDLNSRMMSISVDGVVSAVPMADAQGIRGEQPTWTNAATLGFDWLGFGGVFFHATDLGETGAPLEASGQERGSTTFLLDGGEPGWRPTGIILDVGAHLRVTARGEIYYAGRGPARTTPEGYQLERSVPFYRELSSQDSALVSNVWLGALVYRIGDGPGQFLGSSLEIVATRPGELFLGYNDSYYKDNAGRFEVTVSRH